LIDPVSPVKVVFAPPIKEYPVESKLSSVIEISKFGAVAPNTSLVCGLLIVIIGTETSFLMVTSANPILPAESLA